MMPNQDCHPPDLVDTRWHAPCCRSQRYPHVHECNLCRVCVPMDVVEDHPKARKLIEEGKAVGGAGGRRRGPVVPRGLGARAWWVYTPPHNTCWPCTGQQVVAGK